MGQDERLLHGSSFGVGATAYAEHRPDYAQAAVRWALERAPGSRALDLGAGTGKLTATLVSLGAEVIAVEPDPAMLTELRRALPTVRALPGSAEAVPLPDASVDAVLAGNAMHGFDMNVAGPEIARVLEPDGILAGLWNVFDNRVDCVAELERISGSAACSRRASVRRDVPPRKPRSPWVSGHLRPGQSAVDDALDLARARAVPGHGGDEPVPVDGVKLDIRRRGTGGAPRHVPEKRDLSEVVAGPQLADAPALSRHLDSSCCDDIEEVTDITLSHELGARRGCHGRKGGRRAARESSAGAG